MAILERTEVRCPKCGKKLAERSSAGVLEIKNGAMVLRVYQAEIMTMKCQCGTIVDFTDDYH